MNQHEALLVALNALQAIDEDHPYPIAKHAIVQISKVLAQSENPLDIADRAYFAGKQDGIDETLAQPEQEPANLLKQSEREGWRYANECELEIKRLQNQGCAECGAKSSDGWALYCVRCSEPLRKWIGLTEAEIAEAVGSPIDEVYLNDFRKVEAALRSKNNETV